MVDKTAEFLAKVEALRLMYGRGRPTRMWAIVGRNGRVVSVELKRADATRGFKYHLELGSVRLARVSVTVEPAPDGT